MPVCSVFGMDLPRGMKPFKGILKADKSLLFQGWQKYNSHVVILAYTYQRGSSNTSSVLRWKACSVSRLLQNGCNRFSLLEVSGLGAPSLPPKHLNLCQVAPSIGLSFVIWFPVIINEGQEGWSAVALKPMMGSQASDLTISKIAHQNKIQGSQLCLLGTG